MKLIRVGLITFSVVSASCFGALGRETYEALSASAAQRRLITHVSTWSRGPGVNAANVAHHYADRTIYYGKRMSRREVLRDKLQYIAVWPRRRYSIIPGTVSSGVIVKGPSAESRGLCNGIAVPEGASCPSAGRV